MARAMRRGREASALLLLLVCQCVSGAAASAEGAYDVPKSVFSPSGRLVQLEYVEGIVKRGNLCMGAVCKDGVVLITTKLAHVDVAGLIHEQDVRRIYNVDSHIGLLAAGLPADGRALAHVAMEYCREHRREYGEAIPGRVLAQQLGAHMHAASIRRGIRPYPNCLFIACAGEAGEFSLDQAELTESTSAEECSGEGGVSQAEDPAGITEGPGAQLHASTPPPGVVAPPAAGTRDSDEGFRLYVVEPNGVSYRYRAACTGQGSPKIRGWLHKKAEGMEKMSVRQAARAMVKRATRLSQQHGDGAKVRSTMEVGWVVAAKRGGFVHLARNAAQLP